MQANSRGEVVDGRSGAGGDGSGGGFLKRGTKRDAGDSNLSDFERFEKRLRMLSLRGAEQKKSEQGQLYTPVSHAPGHIDPTPPPHASHVPSHTDNETMHVDDTPDRVYIHDLDAELAELEPEEGTERLIFLPDIEKHFSKIPQQVLANGDDGTRELILYDVPRSLTVDEGHDSVRKAIIESRQRAREKAVEESRQADINRKYDHAEYNNSMETAHGYSAGYTDPSESDPDAMDIG